MTVLFSELKPGDKFIYNNNSYTKVYPALGQLVANGIEAILKEKCLFITPAGYLQGCPIDFLVERT